MCPEERLPMHQPSGRKGVFLFPLLLIPRHRIPHPSASQGKPGDAKSLTSHSEVHGKFHRKIKTKPWRVAEGSDLPRPPDAQQPFFSKVSSQIRAGMPPSLDSD